MCDPVTAAIGTAMTVAGTGMSMYQQAENQAAQQSMQEYQSQVAANNAAIAQQRAQNALNNGEIATQQQQMKTDAALGADRARMSADGLVLSTGSPVDVLDGAQNLGTMDASNILRNASQQAYGYDAQAMNDQDTSNLDQFQGQMTGWNQNMNATQFAVNPGAPVAVSYLLP